jgi:signal transduction histidine kinase
LEAERKASLSRLPKRFVSLDLLCSNAVFFPTPLTPSVLEAIVEQAREPAAREEALRRQGTWLQHEALRELFAAAEPHLASPTAPATRLLSAESPGTAGPPKPPLPRMFWLSTEKPWERWTTNGMATPVAGGGSLPLEVTAADPRFWVTPGRKPSVSPPSAPPNFDWLALRCDESPTNAWFLCESERELGSNVTRLVEHERQIPEYFGVTVEIAGRRLRWPAPDARTWHPFHYGGKGGGISKEYSGALATNVLASATRQEGGMDQLKINLLLTSPEALFERQRARTFWFGSLLASAAGAALVGLVAAWRAFHRQLCLNEMKSNFVSSVSHELRAPIASVRLMAESLESGKVPETPKQQEYFRFISQECRRLSSLIENVLDFSRIEQGRKQYEFEPTDLHALVQQTVKVMATYAAERDVQLEMAWGTAQTSEPLPQTSLDGKAIQQALVNLIDNAIKHSPKGSTVTVGLEVRRIEPGVLYGENEFRPFGTSITQYASRNTHHASLIALWVEDHGEGIPPEEHEKIFDRFYRLGSELRRETQGVGIGLSIVKHIVEAHGGRVQVQSQVGHGSRFTIELPSRERRRLAGAPR